MSFFAEMEPQEPEKRGLLGRLKAFKAGFTDSSPSSMPIVGREPVDGGDSAVSIEPNGVREPRFKSASKPVNPRQASQGQPMTMGMMLRRAQEEAEDVAIIGEGSEREWPAKLEADVVAPTVHQVRNDTERVPESGSAGPMAGNGGNIPLEPAPETVARADQSAEPLQERASTTQPAQTNAEPTADGASQWTSGYDVPPTVRRVGTDVVETPEVGIESGRPRLVHAESLSFKRVLCQRDEHAALTVTESARREFIAVELQAGISIVVATPRFHESQLYATYLKDLARADISVHEEMVGDEDVIAALYGKEKQRASNFVPEASRAIGAFRDVVDAATAYEAGDIHWEYREFAEDVELRLRVDGEPPGRRLVCRFAWACQVARALRAVVRERQT